jgi:hypothetical protein
MIHDNLHEIDDIVLCTTNEEHNFYGKWDVLFINPRRKTPAFRHEDIRRVP